MNKLPKYITRIKQASGAFKPGLYLNYTDPAGKRHRQKLSETDDAMGIVEAVQARDDYLQKFNDLMSALASRPAIATPVGDVFDEYVEARYGSYSEDAHDANSAKVQYRVLKEYFASSGSVIDLTEAHVIERLKALGEERGVQPVTVGAYMRRLLIALNWHARTHDYFDRRPITVTQPRLEERLGVKRKRQRKLPTSDMISAVIENMPADMLDVFYAAVLSGRRKAEIIKLRWDQLTIDHTMQVGVAETPIKSRGRSADEKEWQSWPISTALFNLIERQRDSEGTPFHPNYVFTLRCNKTGKRMAINDSTITKRWERVKKDAGLSDHDFHWHDLRHVALTWAGAHGDKLLVKEMGGHRTDENMERYIHSLPVVRARQIDQVHQRMPFLKDLLDTMDDKRKPTLSVVGAGGARSSTG
jgi:integrase